MKPLFLIAAISWAGLWFTPDQQGRRHFDRGEYAEAARDFQDPLWKGTALYRAGEFEEAARAFARRDTPEAHYNRGNALLLNGKYDDAVAAYERALKERPDWKEASENRDLAAARAKLLEQTGGDQGDQRIGADEIKFDNKKRGEGQETEINTEQAASDQNVQALWLKRVQTEPADFLKSKFSYQEAMRNQEGSE